MKISKGCYFLLGGRTDIIFEVFWNIYVYFLNNAHEKQTKIEASLKIVQVV